MTQLRTPPGPRGTFLIGNTLQYVRDPLGFLTRSVREHGDLVGLRMGHLRYAVLGHPDLIEAVLRGHAKDVVKDLLTRIISPVVGNGLLTSEGAFWRRQRKLATPAFQHDRIRRYGEVMVEHAATMLTTWRDGRAVDVHAAMMALTLGIVAKTLFDAEVGDRAHDVGESLDVMMGYYLTPWQWFRIREHLPIPSTRRFRAAIARVDGVIYDIIRRRRETGEDPGDLLSRLLAARDEDDGSGMTDRQVRDEAVTLFLAGHETTALVLGFTFDLLARNPDAEAKLLAEVDAVLGDRDPTVDDVPKLRYCDRVIKESMRLYPPAWAIGREAIADFELGGYPIKKGTQILLSQWVVHRDPRWFPDPESFLPDRWEDDLAKRLPHGAYFPFGDGPRVCIGNHFAVMEAVLILATVARRFRLASTTGQPPALEPSITLRPRDGLPMVVHERSRPGRR